jgi:hypothetical protein
MAVPPSQPTDAGSIATHSSALLGGAPVSEEISTKELKFTIAQMQVRIQALEASGAQDR